VDALISSHPNDGLHDEEVCEFAHSEHCTAEYQAERSADITQQRQPRIRLLSLDVRLHQLQEEYLHSQ